MIMHKLKKIRVKYLKISIGASYYLSIQSIAFNKISFSKTNHLYKIFKNWLEFLVNIKLYYNLFIFYLIIGQDVPWGINNYQKYR
jgi:hypothetical protein